MPAASCRPGIEWAPSNAGVGAASPAVAANANTKAPAIIAAAQLDDSRDSIVLPPELAAQIYRTAAILNSRRRAEGRRRSHSPTIGGSRRRVYYEELMKPRPIEATRQNVLIIRLGAFGDALQSEGAIRDIRAHHPGAALTVLTTRPFERIFEKCPWIDRILIDPRAPRVRIDLYLRLIATLRRQRFDFIYDLQNSGRTLSYRRWIGSRWSQKDERLLQQRQSQIGGRLSILERLKIQLEEAGVTAAHTLKPDVRWMAADVEALLERAGLTGDFILLVPGSSSKHRHKRWPYYAELAAALSSDGHAVATAPGPDEIDLCRALPAKLLLDGGAPLDYFQLAGVLRRARFVVGNDTGPTHMAAYLGVKGLALFGPHAEPRATGLDSFLQIIEADDLRRLSWREVFEATKAALAEG